MQVMNPKRSTEVSGAVGAQLHQLLWAKKITNIAAGEVIGVNGNTMARKLRGDVAITLDELTALARLLEVEPGQLLPRLDSNQQPSGYPSPQVSAVSAWVLAA